MLDSLAKKTNENFERESTIIWASVIETFWVKEYSCYAYVNIFIIPVNIISLSQLINLSANETYISDSSNNKICFKGTRDKENKEKTKKQTQQPLCSSHLNKGTDDRKQKVGK